ncbi:gas vesicle synthesis protein [Desulfocucumis palustris]|uniref:Gas vesicle synthesis protein n=1 Tax=Desulfocucumis palustris TaxID=1898651 RepID=A0A2L2X8B3_9FIRM|nr:gas vesicle protein [Desulfocucumis palustris]GBF32449.1 gas vesicle synthesis protein [Desulfocucumis palustris]
MQHTTKSTNLAEILERVLDKGLVVAGDIKISLADVELLSIKIRLLIASVDKAREIGINWWENDPYLSTRAQKTLENKNAPPVPPPGAGESAPVDDPAASNSNRLPVR